MSLHTLTNSNQRQARKRVGRGNGNNWGRTCGRGEKGQKSRSGSVIRPHFEGGQIPLFRRLPKRGFKSRNHKVFAIVNIRVLDMSFSDGDSVTVEACQEKKLISKVGAGLKILGDGELTKKLSVTATSFSESAKKKIEAAGGTCSLIEVEETSVVAEEAVAEEAVAEEAVAEEAVAEEAVAEEAVAEEAVAEEATTEAEETEAAAEEVDAEEESDEAEKSAE